MASIRKRGDVWQALVHREGPQGLVRRSASFTTKAEAVSWSIHIEAEILAGKRGQIPDKTFGELLERYAREVSPSKRVHSFGTRSNKTQQIFEARVIRQPG